MVRIVRSFITLMVTGIFLLGCGSDIVCKNALNRIVKATIVSENIVVFEYINNNVPNFSEIDLMVPDGYERYSELDNLGRCGVAFAKISVDTMPKMARKNIGNIKPTGWKFSKYDFVDGKYLYNRCHLIGYQLSAENSNKRNLITGTRFLNIKGMLPFENDVASYIRKTRNHVLYRVTPKYFEDNLVAHAVQIEALSIEDSGAGIKFNVLCHNIQPGVVINYKNGDSNLVNKNSVKIKM